MGALEHEQALLGAIFLKPDIFKRVKVVEEDFESSTNKRIFKAIADQVEDGQPIDYNGVYERLKDKSILAYLGALTENTMPGNWEYYDEEIRAASVKRKCMALARQIEKQSKNGTKPHDIITITQEHLKALQDKLTGTKKSLHEEVREWVAGYSGRFKTGDCYRDLGLVTKQHKKAALMALLRMEKDKYIIRVGNQAGTYRRVDDSARHLDYRGANPHNVIELHWPFDLHKYVKILRKSIVILAGMWDAGKTAFLLNFVHRNMHDHDILYISSEMGEDELRLRLDMFADVPLDFWKFDAIECAQNWEDMIRPNAINVVDYLEIHKDHYEVGDIIRRIFDKLETGIAIIALQKPPGRAMGKGGDVTAEKARLYLSLDPGELTITKGKLWAQRDYNPKGLTFKFKLFGGYKFVIQGEPYRKDYDEPQINRSRPQWPTKTS